jgi:hypothetical protein
VETANQQYHLILADIAMAAAIKTYDRDYEPAAGGAAYHPGSIRDGWLGRTSDGGLRRHVTAMATAGVASLAGMPPERLGSAAAAYGVPLDPDLVSRIAEHFSAKRDAVLTYRR